MCWWTVSGAQGLGHLGLWLPWYSSVLRDTERALVLVSGNEGALGSGGTTVVLPVCLGDSVSSFPHAGGVTGKLDL